MALIPILKWSYYNYTSKTLSRLYAAIMQRSHCAKLLKQRARSHKRSLCSALPPSHPFISTIEGKPHAGKCPHTYILYFLRGCVPGWTSGSGWSVRAVSARLPVGLVEVDVEGSGPVCENRLLGDEAVVASSPALLVGEIHGALVGPHGLVVMIRQRGMRGGSGEGRAHEQAWKSKCERGMWK